MQKRSVSRGWDNPVRERSVRETMTGEPEKRGSAVKERQEALVSYLRVYTFGTFQLAWQVPPSTDEAAWDSRTSARTLCKLLLCAPGRQAPKSVLAGILWPETDEEKARESLRSACKVLRKVLRTADGEDLLEQRDTDGMLKLAEQTRLWVDADAFEDLASQASRASSPEVALALWEEAYTLLRGEFLAEDQHAEWASHRFVKRRRQGLWMTRCRLVRHLADLYVQRGQISLAEEMLEQHLVHFPTDQDALYRLLLHLERQGCFEQASLLYERTRRALEAMGKQPAQHVRARYERFQEAISASTQVILAQAEIPSLRTAPELGRPSSVPLASVLTPGSLPGGREDVEKGVIHATVQGLSSSSTNGPYDDSLEVLRVLLEREGRQDMSMLSRRQFLELGIAAFITRLAQLDSKRISAIEREELGRALSASIADGWKLFHTIGNAEVLVIGQAQLSLVHQAHALLFPSVRSFLYAGAYGIIGTALHFQERHEEALHAYHHAHLAAVATGDPWYIAQNLICQADMYQVLGRSIEALQALEEALEYLGETEEEHRRARAHVLGCWVDTAIHMKNYALAEEKLDESASYVEQLSAKEEFDRSSWFHLAGKYALATGQYLTALDYFQQALDGLPPEWMLRRILVLLPMVAAYTCQGDRDASLNAAEDTLSVVKILNAPMINKPYAVSLHGLREAFPNDPQVRTFVAEALSQLHVH